MHATAAVVDQLVQRELPSGRLVDSDGGGRLRGKIVFSPRGSIPFVEKARRVAVRFPPFCPPFHICNTLGVIIIIIMYVACFADRRRVGVGGRG